MELSDAYRYHCYLTAISLWLPQRSVGHYDQGFYPLIEEGHHQLARYFPEPFQADRLKRQRQDQLRRVRHARDLGHCWTELLPVGGRGEGRHEVLVLL